jgi:lipopolysaccharide export system ATP-binding protein
MIHTLEVDGVQLSFGSKRILSDIYLKCESKKITGLLGRNGQGKSCLMKIIYGSLKCECSIRINNLPFKQSIGHTEQLHYLPQFNFIPKSLSLNRIFHDFGLEYQNFQTLFPEFTSRYKTAIIGMSSGERRLVELYVILKSDSQFALLDEPFTHLNPLQIEKVKELLLYEKNNKGILVTDHMFQHVMDISDALYILKNGKTYLTTSPGDIAMHGYANL